jgi:dTDP-4-amino-4,6-dideoxygalactose transaminase
MVSDRIGPAKLSRQCAHEAAKYIGCHDGFAFREYGRAAQIALSCLELEEGDSVILSPFSSQILLNVLNELELKPLYADVGEDECVVSMEKIEKLMVYSPKAIITSATLGYIPDMEGLAGLGLPIIEDISQGLGGNTGQKKAGRYGEYILVSMEEEGLVTAGGGAVLLGQGRKQYAKIKSLIDPIYSSNIQLPDMNAALALVQLESLEHNLQIRNDIARVYSNALAKSRHNLFVQNGEGENIYYSFPVLLTADLKDVTKYALKKGVKTLPAFEGTCLNQFQIEETPCPVARSIILRCILFPLYPTIGKKNSETISKVLSTLP